MNKCCFLLFCTISIVLPRSIFRVDPTIPTIKVANTKSPTEQYIQKDSHLTYDAIFKLYDHNYLLNNYLPKANIRHYEGKNVWYATKRLEKHLQKLILAIRKGKKKFRHFEILKASNFNENLKCGMIIVKHKKMPFVIKVFIEHPETLVHPTWKGLEPVFFFYMGGTNRHFAGFTRIKNREHIALWANNNTKWKDKILVPRKWFWLPKDPQWICIEGENMRNDNQKETILIPGTYAIIADFFDYKENEKYKKERKNIIMEFCNDINMYVDPHENNFILTKNIRDPNSFCLAIIDTEHFPTMVGIDTTKRITFSSHIQWLCQLGLKCLHDIYFRLKSSRLAKRYSAPQLQKNLTV